METNKRWMLPPVIDDLAYGGLLGAGFALASAAGMLAMFDLPTLLATLEQAAQTATALLA